MSDDAAQRHNELSRKFVEEIGREARSMPELMVVVESILLATMLLLNKRDNISPRHAAGLVDEAVHRATERFLP
jgi:hypothetical protein